MGLGTTISEMLLRLRADTSQAQREFDKLAKKQGKATQGVSGNVKATQKAIKDVTGIVTKSAAVVTGVTLAWEGALAAGQRYAKRSQLAFASAAADIERITAAARGLLTETEAMSFASTVLNSEFSLTQREMETVAAAMVSLRNQGNDWVEVQNRLTQAINEANAEALKPLGINIKAASGEAETLKLIMEAMGEEAEKLSKQTDLAGDSALRAEVRWTNFKDSIADAAGGVFDDSVNAIGEMAEAVSEAGGVFEVASTLAADFYATIIRGEEAIDPTAQTARFRNMRARQAKLRAISAARVDRARRRELGTAAKKLLQQDETIAFLQAMERGLGPMLRDVAGGIERAAKRVADVADGGKKLAPRQRVELLTIEDVFARRLKAPEIEGPLGKISGEKIGPSAIGSSTGTLERKFGGVEAPTENPLIASLREGSEELVFMAEAARIFGESSDSAFGQAVGSVGKWADQMELGSATMSVFQSATSQAFSAWVSGSASAGEAFRMFIGKMLEGLAASMAAKAAEQLGLGIAATFTAPAAAPFHYKSAAVLAGGALLAGGLARKFGGSGAPSPPTSSTVPAGARGAGAAVGPASSSQTLIFVSNPFDDNPRESRRRMSRAMDRAREERGGNNTIVVRG